MSSVLSGWNITRKRRNKSLKSASHFQGWEIAHRFSEQIARFLQKNERMSESLKNERFAHLLICSFLVSDFSDSLMVAQFWWVTSANRSWLLILKEGTSKKRFLLKKRTKNVRKNTILVIIVWANRSFLWVKERFTYKKWGIPSFAHLSWATWANRSWLLICHERPEWFAQGCSFVLSDLSESLTVAQLIWVI